MACVRKCPTKVIKGDVSKKKKVKIDNELCIGCTICKKQCKFDALQGELKEKHSVDESKCVGCHLCMQKCPKKAIKTPIKFNQKAQEAYFELINRLEERERKAVNTAVAREYVNSKKLLPCVEYLLQNGAPVGQRNNSLVALASALFQIGESLESVLETLEEWNTTKNDEPIALAELRATVHSAYNNSRNNIYYGCGAFKELGICVKKCPIHK